MLDPDSLRLDAHAFEELPAVLQKAPAQLLARERLLLYAIVRGLAPTRCLEIGTHYGGSTAITCAALDALGQGRIVCLDPAPMVTAAVQAVVQHRATILRTPSPAGLAEAVRLTGGTFDFVFVDGDHTSDGVFADLMGVVEVASEHAVLLCHDAHHGDVRSGIDRFVAASPVPLIDVGLVSTEATSRSTDGSGRQVEWGGLRMLRLGAHRGRLL